MTGKANPNQAHETAPEGIEWESIQLGLGESWDFEHNGPLTGHYLASTTRPVTDKETGEVRETKVHQFAEYENPDEVVFVWGSKQLDDAFSSDLIRTGDLLRISFLGIDQFTDKATGKPRVIKRYRVQLAKRPA